MKKIFLFLILIFSIKSISQNTEKSVPKSLEKTILLLDSESKLPIQDATVLILRSKQILVSNAEGKVVFVIHNPSNIQISHSAYAEVTIRSTILTDTEYIIYLNSNVNVLDEIILTRQHPQKILKKLVQNSIDELTVPVRLQVYEREFFKLNGVYSYYNDGLMNFQILDKKKLYDTDILVEQNRSYGLIDKEISDELLGYNLNNIIGNYYSFKYLEPLLQKDALKKYDFIVKAYADNENYYMMKVYPNENTKQLLDDFTIIYDNKKKLIIEVSSILSPRVVAKNIDKIPAQSKNIYESFFKTIYKFDGSNYYLISSREEIGFEKVHKKNATYIEVKNSFVVTNFSNKFFTHKETDVFKDQTMFNKRNVIFNNYWEISGLSPTDEEQEIISRIIEK